MMLKIRRSRLLDPGDLTFGSSRLVPTGLAYRMRTFFALTSARLYVLALTTFFIEDLFTTTPAFDTMDKIAPQQAWGIMMFLIGTACLLAVFKRDGRIGRAAIVCSGTLMAIISASFLSIAWQYGVGWWGVVAYFSLAAVDFLTASYSGEKVR